MSTISVIIPTHNSARTLRRAIKSAREADEIIVVDDASTDDTKSVLSQLSESLPNIKVIRNVNNVGADKSRKAGLKAVESKWVTFLDADDYLSNRSIKRFKSIAANATMDILQARIMLRISALRIPYPIRSRYDVDKAIDACLYDDRLFPIHCCGKFYRRELLESINFIESIARWGEDRLFNLSIMSALPRIEVDMSIRYNYVVRHGFNHHKRGNVAEEIREVSSKKIDWCQDKGLDSYIPWVIQERDRLIEYAGNKLSK